MGPKKSKKSEQKAKDKIVEDKTFGLKNKNKSKNVQKYIQEVTKQVKGGNTRADRVKEQQMQQKKKAKDDVEALKSLFASAITQPKVPPGVDPKSMLCAFFKQGACTKGSRCKFSHDLNVEKKSAKIDLYSDMRDAQKEADQMDNWDQNKLESVISEKHGSKAAKQTDIVCKHFLDAIEKSLYGWFWVCPNGGKACKYRHALPPGYVFMSKADREAEKAKKVQTISIEEVIEQQRKLLGPTGGTPVTAESLAKWKADKIARKVMEEEKRLKEEAKKSATGRGVMSGRALFSYDPSIFHDDADADDDEYSNHDDEENLMEEKLPASVNKSLYVSDDVNLELLKK